MAGAHEGRRQWRKLTGQMVNGKVWTEQDYKRWRLNQIGRGERYIALRDAIARRMTQANEVAVAYVNDATPGIYTLNRNYAAYAIEQVAGDVGFTLWDEQAVKRLIVENADVMPYYPPERALRRGIDLAYGKKQITKSVTSGLLQGKSVGKIATDLQARVMEMNRASAVRAARTAVTAAQNGGRMDSYKAAEAMGIRLQKEWLATLDNRTRHAHALLDGQRADVDAPFLVEGREIRYPGDPQAAGDLVYNCRCTLVAAVEESRREHAKPGRREMTYREWQTAKEQSGQFTKRLDYGTIKENVDGGDSVQIIAALDKEKYSGISTNIRSAIVVLTENQRLHIIERRGQAFYDRYSPYFREIAESPDYIFADKKHANTALVAKTLEMDGTNIHLVIRLAVETDEEGMENSIITAIVENEKRYNQRLRNNTPLYKRE